MESKSCNNDMPWMFEMCAEVWRKWGLYVCTLKRGIKGTNYVEHLQHCIHIYYHNMHFGFLVEFVFLETWSGSCQLIPWCRDFQVLVSQDMMWLRQQLFAASVCGQISQLPVSLRKVCDIFLINPAKNVFDSIEKSHLCPSLVFVS